MQWLKPNQSQDSMSRSLNGFSYVQRMWRPDTAVILFVVVFFAAFFVRVIAQNRFILTGDAFYYTYPMRTIAWQIIGDGSLPLWTPLILSGYPLLAAGQLALGYPFTWTHLFLPAHWAEQIYVLTPFLLSPLTTYAYSREIGRSRLASLLAGLSFGYGGMMCGILANNGMLTNSLVWGPLVLLFIERARTRSFVHCVCWAGAAYALSVLAGQPQGFVYVGFLAIAYGVFSSTLVGVRETHSIRAWKTWRPIASALGAIGLGAGVAAFQLFETSRAARRSIRSSLTYEFFSEASFSFREALLSLGAQIYHYIDSGTYVTPLSLLLAPVAVITVLSRHKVDERIWFWLGVAIVSWILLLGSNTPLNKIIYHVPVINLFRAPSRHTFEWTFSISILAAYGWDLVQQTFRNKRQERGVEAKYKTFAAFTFVILAAILGYKFWLAVTQQAQMNPPIYTSLPERSYWLWKIAFAATVFAATWFSFQVLQRTIRACLLATVIFLACFVEANATASCWWAGFVSLPDARFHAISPSTRYLQQFAPEQNRVYTYAGLFSEEFSTDPRLEAPNLTMLTNLQNVAGYEPLILQRYSRALGDVGPDSVTGRLGIQAKHDLFMSRSHVLNILNTTHAVTYSGSIGIHEEVTNYHDGVRLSVGDLGVTVAPGQSNDFGNLLLAGDELVLVTSLSNSVSDSDNTPVARARFYLEGRLTIDRDILAGVHTAEWAHERPDVRAKIKHRLATVFDQRPGDAANSFSSFRYWARLKLGSPQRVERVRITNLSQTATITIWKLSLFNSQDSQSSALGIARSPAWRRVFEDRGVEVLNNANAMPRAWLVPRAQAVDGETALRAIRGESAEPFDPRETVLLEIRPDELPKLPDERINSPGDARIVDYQPTQLTIETNTSINSVLVVSEIFYPGWEATIDGQRVPIMLGNYLLRAVAVPAGQHRVQMRYRAGAARNGAILSAITLAVLIGLMIQNRRASQAQRSEQEQRNDSDGATNVETSRSKFELD